jgi:hypothetical protein
VRYRQDGFRWLLFHLQLIAASKPLNNGTIHRYFGQGNQCDISFAVRERRLHLVTLGDGESTARGCSAIVGRAGQALSRARQRSRAALTV